MGALMDISAQRAQMDESAKALGLAHFGEGWTLGMEADTTKALTAVAAIYVDPACWATRLDAALLVSIATSDEMRRQALVNLAALATALIEDIDRKKEST